MNAGTLPPPLDTGLVAIILPVVSSDLRAHISIASWVPIVYLIIITALMPLLGQYSDRRSRKNMFILGLLTFAVGAYLSGSSFTIYELLIYRALQGVGAALVLANSRALISDVFEEKGGGLAMGVHVAVIYFALLMGPLLGGVMLTLTSLIGWRDVFLLNVPLCLASALLVYIALPRGATTRGNIVEKTDWLGGVLLLAGLFSLLGGVTLWPVHKGVVEVLVEEIRITFLGLYFRPFFYVSFPAWMMVAAGLACIALFFLRERRKNKSQIIPLNLLSTNLRLRSASLAILLLYTAHHGVWIVVSFYLTAVVGLDPITAGFILGVLPLTVLAVSPVGGFLSDRYGHSEVSTLGLFIAALSLFSLSLISPQTTLLYTAISLAMLGVGIGLFAAPNTNSALASVASEVRAQVNGLMGFMRHLGQSLSIAISAAILDYSIGYEKFLEGGVIELSAFTRGVGMNFLLGGMIAAAAAVIVVLHETAFRKRT
ncbi:MAG: MFS transporter [Candidatus Caldarchaeum sp.]|nr:MFS transporter [Candidatus Caldarchaeum sp.]MCS7138024.1 MFS transporter [Candidatus Caldarchaeum sp.]